MLSNIIYENFKIIKKIYDLCFRGKCDGNGNCLSCSPIIDFRVIAVTTRRCLPLIGYFEDMTQVCPSCPQNCSICVSATKCQACLTGYFMNSSNLCSDTCPLRFYPSLQTFSCQACPYDCLTCDDKGQCLSCSVDDFRIIFLNISRCLALPGYYDNKTQVCLKCPTGCYLCQS